MSNHRFELIRAWAETRGLYDKGDVKTQYVKLGEEFGELGHGIIKQKDDEIKDAIGDMVVVLTNLAHLAGFEIEDCIDSAYEVINKRTGKMVNGSFIKDEPIDTEIPEGAFAGLLNGNEEYQPANGEVYECISLEESDLKSWSHAFTVGHSYVSKVGEHSFKTKEDGLKSLCLITGPTTSFYVDYDCFKKVKQE